MVVYVADDERLILQDNLEIIQKVMPDAEIEGFRRGGDLLAAAQKKACHIAFLDIHMMDMDGVELAARLKEINPRVNIIFVTAYDDYYRNAMELHASGYLLKPLVPESVEKELKELRYTDGGTDGQGQEEQQKEVRQKEAVLQVTCIGNFDVRNLRGERVHFERQKSKEAFAYLIHLKGAPCTMRQLAAVLFEDEPFDKKSQMYIQKIVSSLMKTMRDFNAEKAVEKKFNSISVNCEFLDCDYYRWMEEDAQRRYQLPDNYMMQYSWGRF